MLPLLVSCSPWLRRGSRLGGYRLIRADMSQWPACTHHECGADSFGPYHGVNCARSRFMAEQLQAWGG